MPIIFLLATVYLGIGQISTVEKYQVSIAPSSKSSSEIKVNVDKAAAGLTSEEKAMNYIKENWRQRGHKAKADQSLFLKKIHRMPGGDIVRFRQKFKGLRVGMCEYSVKINKKDRVSAVLNSTIPIPDDFNILPGASEEQAWEIVRRHFGLEKDYKKKRIELTIQSIHNVPRLVYEIGFSSYDLGNWCSYVDGHTNRLLHTKILSSNLTGRGKVFDPSPTNSAKKPYGSEPNYEDNGDANNGALEWQTVEVDLEGITKIGNDYFLIGDYAEIFDAESFSPSEAEGLYEQPSDDFTHLSRDDRAFEAVMCYYNIDKVIRYINEDLGVEALPTYQKIQFDPHTSTVSDVYAAFFWNFGDEVEQLLFSDGKEAGDVDLGEDAFVIVHEAGHAIHHWLTNENYSNEEGASEALSDFLGQSMSKDCSLFGVYQEWQPEYSETFHWGGMPSIEPLQRTTNYNPSTTYSPGGGGAAHVRSQYLSTALMRIFSDLGKEKTDLLVLGAMPFIVGDSGPGSNDAINLTNAGAFIYQAAVDQGFTPNELCIVYKHLDDMVGIGTHPDTPVAPPPGGTLDIYMKDGPCDSGIEPNNVTQYMFHSPDIWVRQEQDGELMHENPEYKINGNNFVYVRLRSRGCVSQGDVQLQLYWSKASTGLDWDEDWTTAQVMGPNGMVPAGGEITNGPLTVPLVTGNSTLEAGGEKIVMVAWDDVPNPDDYFTDVHHFCLLARITATGDPMTFTEVMSTENNARNNNNITAKNVSIFDDKPGIVKGPVSVFVDCQSGLINGGIRIESAKHPLGKSIFDYGNVYLELVGSLDNDWTGGGMPGGDFQVMQDGKIHALNENFHLDNLNLGNCQNEVVNVYFEPFTGDLECAFDLAQYDANGLDGSNSIGRERFEYYPGVQDLGEFDGPGSDKSAFRISSDITLYPNPANSMIAIMLPKRMDSEGMQYHICDLNGVAIQGEGMRGQLDGRYSEIDLGEIPPGLYFVKLSDEKGGLVESLKFIKQ